MKFNERLIAARTHAKLTQQEVINRMPRTAEGKPLMSQANLAKLEKNPDSKGSMWTIVIADICGVDAMWLTTGNGEMLPAAKISGDAVYAKTEKQAKVLLAMQSMPEYKQEALVNVSHTFIEPEANGSKS